MGSAGSASVPSLWGVKEKPAGGRARCLWPWPCPWCHPKPLVNSPGAVTVPGWAPGDRGPPGLASSSWVTSGESQDVGSPSACPDSVAHCVPRFCSWPSRLSNREGEGGSLGTPRGGKQSRRAAPTQQQNPGAGLRPWGIHGRLWEPTVNAHTHAHARTELQTLAGLLRPPRVYPRPPRFPLGALKLKKIYVYLLVTVRVCCLRIFLIVHPPPPPRAATAYLF